MLATMVPCTAARRATAGGHVVAMVNGAGQPI